MRTTNLLPFLFLSLFLAACSNPSSTTNDEAQSTPEMEEVITFLNKGHELVYNFVQKVGDHSKLSDKKDVVYTYTYETPDGKTDITTEKYIFDGELSYGEYTTHQRTLADLEGKIEQGYDGTGYWVTLNDEPLDDEKALKRAAFSRPTNYYWFTMMQKLLDPGLVYEHIGEQDVDGVMHDVVKVSFAPSDKPTDIYQLYINKETGLIDQFLFTVADFGKMDTPSLLRMEYENVDGLLIPTKRQYKKSTWEADVDDKPWINVTWSDIKFDNGLTKADFKS